MSAKPARARKGDRGGRAAQRASSGSVSARERQERVAFARSRLRTVSALDLVADDGRFKRADELPRRVLKELERFTVDGDGRICGFRFRERNPYPKFTLSKKRKKKRITKAMDRELLRRLERELALLRAARAHGA